ncbi:class I SAM-dependent DNA methyltransferase [Jeotgalibaca arthritidis]|uniref:site-specific DNA-methyltransferase (adenine-specific) n=1 Tax=Jeotgalibaca arthritidis TaxID=1868794 RepID=A0A6G7KAJ4_9LACT|nr:class I SAM-dependent DNA methyltransferase [Jeotgalibaca arthritidis]QII82289.1 class I SAM-dependent DNA methyltransferase [Jeotgalibaca arthritidis]
MAKNKVLNITEIEDGLKKLISDRRSGEFITSFLGFYDIPKTSITRALKKFNEGEPFVIKNKLHYEEIEGDVVVAIDAIQHDIADQKSKPRYIMVNDFSDIAAIDTKTGETLNIPIAELPANADFFLAWNGIEKADYQAENPADRKAAERFAKLYDVVAKDNPDANEHAFNLFLIRVLFLLFAEDTGIMNKGSFTNVLKTRTSEDGSNFNAVIKDLFEVLDINQLARNGKEAWLLEFPYVNGKLFGEPHVDLVFSKVSRELLIEAGEMLNWDEINPDILGAMIQSVASAEDRHVAGMHYTSVPNIMKVIKPLFLDELTEAFDSLKTRYEGNELKDITEKTRKENKKGIISELHALIDRISKIKFLDPASGSGNFLIIAYKEIRRLEIKILQLLEEIEDDPNMPLSSIHLGNFNGIELDDFAHEVAKLSLWIAEHQMNKELEEALPGTIAELLPLKDAGNILCANSLRVDWNEVLPHKTDDEIYLMGNPPYLGSKLQNKEQKADLEYALEGKINSKRVDYITGWFYKGTKFIANSSNKLAFVSTNSINQGEQVSYIWPTLLKKSDISFAYSSFKWGNSAKGNAGVTVVIIGLCDAKNSLRKYLFNENGRLEVSYINPYLTSGKISLVSTHNKSISGLPDIMFGSMPNANGLFDISPEEYSKMAANETRFVKKIVGGKTFIEGTINYTYWFEDDEFAVAKSNPKFVALFNSIKEYRTKSNRAATKKLANRPWSFGEVRYKKMPGIIIPATSSEARDYVPMGVVDEDTIVNNSAYVIYGGEIWLLGLLESRMHMVWLESVGGKLETRYRYSAGLVYNTFPVNNLSTQRKNEIARVMTEILDLREYEGGTLADLYNTATMPESLRKKHEELDGIVDRAYQQRTFDSDEERLAILLKLYQEMTNND